MKRILLIFAWLVCFAITAMAQAKCVFFFIGDGMGLGSVMVTEAYNRTVLNNTEHLTMLQFPVISMATSYSANRHITDS